MKKLKYKVPDSSAQMLTTKHADLEEQKEWKDTCIIKERDDIKKKLKSLDQRSITPKPQSRCGAGKPSLLKMNGRYDEPN